MTIPSGATPSKTNQVCKLYGLKQASKKWNEKFNPLLIKHNYYQATFDHSLFIKHNYISFNLLKVYVDGVII